MTEKLQLVDAGLGERETCRRGTFHVAELPLEKSKRLPRHCANLVATGHSNDGNSFLLLVNFEALAYLTVVTTKIKWQEVHIGHVY